jgi:hypothetical protein
MTISDPRQRALNDGVLKRQHAGGLHRIFWEEMTTKSPEAFDLDYVDHVRKLIEDGS